MKYVLAVTVVGDHKIKNEMWDTEVLWNEIFINFFFNFYTYTLLLN